MTQEPSTQTQPKRPGARLMKWGLVLLGIGIAFCAIGFGSASPVVDPRTLTTVYESNGPTPLAWVVLIAGIVMTAAGFAKRRG